MYYASAYFDGFAQWDGTQGFNGAYAWFPVRCQVPALLETKEKYAVGMITPVVVKGKFGEIRILQQIMCCFAQTIFVLWKQQFHYLIRWIRNILRILKHLWRLGKTSAILMVRFVGMDPF